MMWGPPLFSCVSPLPTREVVYGVFRHWLLKDLFQHTKYWNTISLPSKSLSILIKIAYHQLNFPMEISNMVFWSITYCSEFWKVWTSWKTNKNYTLSLRLKFGRLQIQGVGSAACGNDRELSLNENKCGNMHRQTTKVIQEGRVGLLFTRIIILKLHTMEVKSCRLAWLSLLGLGVQGSNRSIGSWAVYTWMKGVWYMTSWPHLEHTIIQDSP